MFLAKRDNMGFQIAPALIIFLVILGAGGLVCCGFAIFRFYSGDIDNDSAWTRPRSREQDVYMRSLREANWAHLRRVRGLPNCYNHSDRILTNPPTARPWHFVPQRPILPTYREPFSDTNPFKKQQPTTEGEPATKMAPTTSSDSNATSG